MTLGPLILDLDGVVRVWDPDIFAAAERDHGLVRGALSDAVLGDAALLRAAVTGRITDAHWRDKIAERLAGTYGPAAKRAVQQWSRAVGAVDAGVLDVVREQRRGRTVALFSNATDRLSEDLCRLGLDPEFDAVLSSAELGLAKPAPAAFRRVCSVLGAVPGECTLVDDSEQNVTGARTVGLRAHRYVDVGSLREFLAGPS